MRFWSFRRMGNEDLLLKVRVPKDLAHYAIDLGHMFDGMIKKLEDNADKGDILGANPNVVLSELLGEVAEMTEQMGVDFLDKNMKDECFDVANYAFLMYRLFENNRKKQHVKQETEE